MNVCAQPPRGARGNLIESLIRGWARNLAGAVRYDKRVHSVTLQLLFVGRPRDAHANALAREYIKRASRFLDCRMTEIDPRRYDVPQRHAAAFKVFLDPAGTIFDSGRFLELIQSSRLAARDLVFLVGAHDGLPAKWRPQADLLLSLTPLTLPHELARAVLAEQIYRALAALNHHPYGR